MLKGPNPSEDDFNKKKDDFFVLLTKSLHYNCLGPLKDLDATPLYLVSGVHKGYAHGDYLPLSMV